MKLSINALEVLKRRYLFKDYKGKIIESPKQMFKRVAKAIASVDKKYKDHKDSEKDFFNMMSNLEFLPNSPTLMNAGTHLSQLSACFVLPVEDSIESIFDGVKNMAIIHKTGGGTGFNFSNLRPKRDIVMSTKGIASGPVSFMTVYDAATGVINQGGKRRGANMGIMNVNHPDILSFISAKSCENFLRNFNLSVSVKDSFMQSVKQNKEIKLINPRNKRTVNKLKAKKIFDLIIENAWKTGDPGMVFIDEINRKNPLKQLGRIESTNPCGEQPLLPYESCNLGSINLSKFVKDKKIDWDKLKEVVRNAVHFLDNVIDLNNYPLQKIHEITLANRKIGLGVMGWAELLIKLEIPYDSKEALKLAEKVMRFITTEARNKSVELGAKRGSFPNFKKSVWKKKYKSLRNATVTTIAPTGTISIIAHCSSGIEPLFAVSFLRIVMEGTKLLETNELFEKAAKERKFYSKKLMEQIAKKGSLQKIKNIPKDIKNLFITAHDLKPEVHVKMQAAFQKYTDNAVSKTCNLKHDAKKEDIKKIYLLAHKLKCKGITVYRYGCKKEQVLNITEKVYAESEYAGGCPAPYCPF